MTPILCAEHVANMLAKELDGRYSPTDPKLDGNTLTIRSGFLPKATSAAEKHKQNPAIVIRPTEVSDDSEGSEIKLLALVSVYNEDKENGHKELYHLLEVIRQAVLTNTLLDDRNMLHLPVKTIIPEEQPFPVWWGYMELRYSIGQPHMSYF